MLKWLLAVLLLGFTASALPKSQDAAVTFAAFDVFADSGNRTLGAWQFEWLVRRGQARIVGVEGGDGVFATAPYYDLAALQSGRIVVAAFSTATPLPQGKVRIARLHLQIDGGEVPQFAVQPQACADGAGATIEVAMSWQKMETK